MIEQGVARMMDCENTKEYVTLVNNKLQDKLLFRQGFRDAPASPSSSDASEHPPVPMPAPLIGTQPAGRRRKNFVYPDPQRRLRSKTTPPKLPEGLEMLAVDAEKADAIVLRRARLTLKLMRTQQATWASMIE